MSIVSKIREWSLESTEKKITKTLIDEYASLRNYVSGLSNNMSILEECAKLKSLDRVHKILADSREEIKTIMSKILTVKANEVSLVHLANTISQKIPKDAKFEKEAANYVVNIENENNTVSKQLGSIKHFLESLPNNPDTILNYVSSLYTIKKMLADAKDRLELMIKQLNILLGQEKLHLST